MQSRPGADHSAAGGTGGVTLQLDWMVCPDCKYLVDTPNHELGCATGRAAGRAVEAHIHVPVIVTMTCDCGESTVWQPATNEFEHADHNWRAVIRRIFK